MSSFPEARAWLREHPRAGDSLVGLLVVLVTLAPFVVSRFVVGNKLDLTPLSFAVVVTGSALLVLRRQFTRTVWLATTSMGLLVVLVDAGPSPAYLPAIVALYTLTTLCPLRLTVVAAVVTALAPAVIVLARTGSTVVDAFVFGLTAWSGLAAATGVAVRNQRAVVAAAHERARQAEATQEEEAQRRVTEDRLRIARELHDVVAHHISVINVQAGVAGHLVRSDPDKAVEALAHVREASQVVLREVPGLLGLLRTGGDELERSPAPQLADAGALVEAARRSGLDVTWRTTGSPVLLAPGVDLTAYRVLQEALTNAARHGSGTAIAALGFDAAGCVLEVRNARAGGLAAAGAERHGLVGMRERVTAVGGEITVGPEGARDWVVRVRLPVQHEVPRESAVEVP